MQGRERLMAEILIFIGVLVVIVAIAAPLALVLGPFGPIIKDLWVQEVVTIALFVTFIGLMFVLAKAFLHDWLKDTKLRLEYKLLQLQPEACRRARRQQAN